jgi:DsbC/DsbD-like thiol-disulfide interchange protein
MLIESYFCSHKFNSKTNYFFAVKNIKISRPSTARHRQNHLKQFSEREVSNYADGKGESTHLTLIQGNASAATLLKGRFFIGYL